MRYLTTLVFTAALFMSSLAAPLSGAAGQPPEIARLELNSYKQDFGVSTAAAERNLAIQQRGAGIVEVLEGTLGKDYAGVWFDNQTGEFVIPTVTDHATVVEALRGLHLEGHFRTTPAHYSWKQLEAAQRGVNGALKDSIHGKQLTDSYLDPRDNSVVIREAKDLAPAGEAAVEQAAGSEPGKVKVESLASARLRTSIRDCTNTPPRTCGKPLRGGIDIGPITILKGGGKSYFSGTCSAGFKATGNLYGNKFMLTAGHCVALHGLNHWGGETPGGEMLEIGNTETYTFGPGGDWAAINANSSEWGTSGWETVVANYTGNLQYPISTEAPSYVGEYACLSGSKTGTHCGNVAFVHLTGGVDDLTGSELPPEDGLEGVCTIGGDSGGPIFAPTSELALGIMSAALEEEGGGTCWAEYVEITDATDSLGVTVGSRVGAPPVVESAEGEVEEEPHGIDGVAPHRVTAHGSVDPNGITSNYHYEYGTTTGYGQSTSLYGAGSGWSASAQSATLANLKGSTTYHYRIVGQNSAGTAYGGDQTFTTPSWPPIVSTNAPTGVIHQEATLNGSVNPQAEATTYHFEYGLKGPCGSNACTSVPIPDASAGSGESTVPVSQKLTGLEDGTWHYRIVASNGEGTSYGGDQTFLIDNRPLIKGTTATSVKSGSATLKGEIEPQNFASTYHFEYVRDSEFKEEGFTCARKLPVPDASAGTGFEWHSVSQETGTTLEPDTLYHYRLVATNVKGTRIGEEKTLRTPPVTPVSDLTFGTPGSGEGQLSEPHGLGEDESGNLWVADTGNSRLEKFSPEGAFISTFGKHGSGHGEFLTVNDVTSMAGKVWAVDSGRDRLLGFSSKGEEESWRGEGQFEDPLGITVNPGSFDIWVSDHDKHRVLEYGLSGEPVRTITGGSGNGPALEGPAGIQWDVHSGKVWVADSTAGRVLAYGSQGEYKSSFGENGIGTGQLHHPNGVAVLSSGDLVVTDGDAGGSNSRIQVFSSSGEYLGTFAGPQAPAFGDVLYAGGYLYATESGEGVARVRRWHFPQAKVASEGVESIRAEKAILTGKIDPWGTKAGYRFEYGTTKAYGSQAPVPDRTLESETGVQEAEQEITGLLPATTYHYRLVATNSNGAGYGADMTFKTASAKAPSASTEAVSAVGVSHATLNGTVNPNGAKTSYRFEYVDAAHWAVGHYGSATSIPVPDKEIGSGSSPVAVSQEATSLQPHTLYHARVRAGNAEGTVYGESRVFTTPGVFNPPTYASAFGAKGSGNGQLSEAQGIATDPSGNVWVSDTGNNRIEKFNSKGEYACQIGTKGSGNGQFSSPRGLASDSKGNLWVADTANNRIEEVGPSCEYLAQIGKAGTGAGGLQAPRDVAIDPSGNLWVADSGNARIEELNSKGEFLAACGSKGTGNGQFEAAPLSIGTDSDANVWAGDEAGRLEKFSSKCAFLASFDKTSSAAPAKVQPADFAIDPPGNIWVPSSEAHDVQGFYPEGEYLAGFGKEGTGAGQFTTPAAIAAGSDGTLWVIDNSASNSRVEKWTPGAAYAVQTGQATGIKRTEATFTGKINPEGKATSYRFEYGTTQTFGSWIPATPKSIGSGTEAVAVSQSLDGLKAATTYWYHLVATTEAGTTYGETRHFTTLAAPLAGSQVLIGGQSFAELGIKEATVRLEGHFTIKFMPEQNWPTYECQEEGTGALASTGLSHEEVTLRCVVVSHEASCHIQPIHFYVNGKFEGSTPWTLIVAEGGNSCGFAEEIELAGPTGSFGYGSQAKSLNVTATGTSSFGTHEVKLSGDSHWQLESYIGKELAFALPKPTSTTEAASAIQAFGATLNGTVNPNGGATTYRFEYVDASHYAESGYTTAAKAPILDGSAGSGTAGVKESQAVSGLQSGTTYHVRLVATNAEGTTSYGADQTFTTVGPLNTHWRIEGKTLAEQEAWEPYESHGTLVIDETTALSKPIKITCQETGSGTLGYQEVINISKCEVRLEGKVMPECEAHGEGPITLNSEFHGTKEWLTEIEFGTGKCSIPTTEVSATSAFSFEAGSSAAELGATMSGGGVHFGVHTARLTLTSTWKLTGKYKGQKFAYAGNFASLNTHWRIEGKTLAERQAWEPYESHGTLVIDETTALSKPIKITCQETGSGTLGYQEVINISKCEVKLEEKVMPECEGHGESPITLNGEFKGAEAWLTQIVFGTGTCSIPTTEVSATSAFSFEAGSSAAELGATMSGGGVHFGVHTARLTLTSTWKLTGKYKGSEFGYS